MTKSCNPSRISLNILDNFSTSVASGTGLKEGIKGWKVPSTKTTASLVSWWEWTLKKYHNLEWQGLTEYNFANNFLVVN